MNTSLPKFYFCLQKKPIIAAKIRIHEVRFRGILQLADRWINAPEGAAILHQSRRREV
jgi:hypothetical protein